MPDLTRRALVRAAAGTAWTIPVVAFAGRASATTVSGDVVVGEPEAYYPSIVTVDEEELPRPDRIAAVLPIDLSGPKREVVVIVNADAAFGDVSDPLAASVQSTESGSQLTYVQQMESGAQVFSTVLCLDSTQAAPFLGLRGSGGGLEFQVIDGVRTSEPIGCDVWKLVKAKFTDVTTDRVLASSDDTSAVFEVHIAGLVVRRPQDLHGIGPVTVHLGLPKAVDGVLLDSPPEIDLVGSAAGRWEALAAEDEDNDDYWVRAFTTCDGGFAGMLDADLSGAPDQDEHWRGPGRFDVELLLRLPDDYDGPVPDFSDYSIDLDYSAEGLGITGG